MTEFPTNLVPNPHIHFSRATYPQASQLRRPMLSSCLRSRPMPASSQPVKWPSRTLATASTWFAACGIGGTRHINTAFTSIRMKCTTRFVDVAQLDLKWASTISPPTVIPRETWPKCNGVCARQATPLPRLSSGPARTVSVISRRRSENVCVVHGGRHEGRRGH